MQTMKQAAAEFLAGKRVAVTGVSRKAQGHGSNAVYQRLRQRGYQVFAVNPNADHVEGDPCYHDLASVPGGVDWVVIGTRPETAEATIRECGDLGIKRVWMHRGPGPGSVSKAAAEYGRQHGITVIAGRVPVHVRPHRRSRSQGDAVRVHPDRQRTQARVKRSNHRRLTPAQACADMPTWARLPTSPPARAFGICACLLRNTRPPKLAEWAGSTSSWR